jgi:hypothetical protein
MVPDIFYKDGKFQPSSPLYSESNFAAGETSWHPVQERSDITTLDLAITELPPDDNFSMMLSIGIRYGAVINGGAIEQVKYVGCAKVLTLA